MKNCTREYVKLNLIRSYELQKKRKPSGINARNRHKFGNDGSFRNYKNYYVMLELKRITTEYAWGISDDIHPEVRKAGVYLLYDKNNFLIYIGQSINIHQRLKSHCKNDNKKWDYARVIIIENQGHRYVVEKLLIEYINPLNNKLKASCSDVNFNLNIEKLMNMQKLSCISLLEINKLENIIDEFQSQNILDLELSNKTNKQISKFKCEIMNLNYLIASYIDFANLGLKQ